MLKKKLIFLRRFLTKPTKNRRFAHCLTKQPIIKNNHDKYRIAIEITLQFFYLDRLKSEELIELNKRLTASELSVYLWLKTNDPFGERLVEADTKVIAKELNISRRSVQRALAKLQKEKLIDVVITKFFYRVKSKATEESDDNDKIKEKLRVTTPVSPDDISVANGTRMSPTVRQCRHQYENVANSTPMSSSEAETQSGQNLQNPKTLQTYSDFKKTLSKTERENFLKFVREQIHNLERPINDLEAWLASKNAAEQNRWEVYYKNYQDQKDGQKPRNAQKTSRQGKFCADESSAIARWQKRLQEQQAAAEAALRKSHPSFQQTNPAAELENSLSDGLNDSEGAATDKSNKKTLLTI